jgi:hypothetical protein
MPIIRTLLSCTFGLLLVPMASQVASAQTGYYGQPVSYEQPRDHGFEITGVAGYQVATPTFDGVSANGVSTYVTMAASPSYGVMLSRLLRPGFRSELSWRFEPTHLTVAPAYGSSSQTDLAMHYFTAAASFERGTERVKGYGLIGMGAMLAHPDSPSLYGDEWFFSFAFALGLKLWLNEHFGIRLESRLEVPVRFSSGGLWCINGACAVALSDGHAIAQFDFVGGPVLAF